VNSKRVARREEEDKARAERKVMSEEDQELCRKRAEDKLSAKQQEELQRLRTEDSSTDSASGGATEANHAEIRRRAAAVGQAQTDPYGVLELDAEAQMTTIRKAYRSHSANLVTHPVLVDPFPLLCFLLRLDVAHTHTHTHTHTQNTHTQTHKHTNTHTHTDTHKHPHTHTHTHTHAHTHTHTHGSACGSG